MPHTSRPVNIFRGTAPQGNWQAPAIRHVSLGLSLAHHRSTWRDRNGLSTHHVHAGEIALCPYGQSRMYSLDRPTDFAVVVLSDHIMQEVSEAKHTHPPELQDHPSLKDDTVSRLAHTLLEEHDNDYANGSLFLDSLATALANYLYNRYATRPSNQTHVRGGLAPAALRRNLDYIQEHLGNAIRLSDLARESGISTAHYARMFRQSMGITPHQYLIRQRVERARQLIRNKAMRLADIASACGFADQQHMARIFRQVTGVSPNSFRRSH